jgi:hypothetical protein
MMSPKAAVSNTMSVNQLHLGTSSYGTSSIVRPSSNSEQELNVLYVHIEISNTENHCVNSRQSKSEHDKNHNLDFIARLLNVCWLYTLGCWTCFGSGGGPLRIKMLDMLYASNSFIVITTLWIFWTSSYVYWVELPYIMTKRSSSPLLPNLHETNSELVDECIPIWYSNYRAKLWHTYLHSTIVDEWIVAYQMNVTINTVSRRQYCIWNHDL